MPCLILAFSSTASPWSTILLWKSLQFRKDLKPLRAGTLWAHRKVQKLTAVKSQDFLSTADSLLISKGGWERAKAVLLIQRTFEVVWVGIKVSAGKDTDATFLPMYDTQSEDQTKVQTAPQMWWVFLFAFLCVTETSRQLPWLLCATWSVQHEGMTATSSWPVPETANTRASTTSLSLKWLRSHFNYKTQ